MKKYFQKLISLFLGLKLKTKLFTLYIAFAIVPIIIVVSWFLITTTSENMKNTKYSLFEVVKKNNYMINSDLATIDDVTNSLMNNYEFYAILKDIEPGNIHNIYANDKKIITMLKDNYSRHKVESAYVLTSFYGFGSAINSQMFYPYRDFYNSDIYKKMIHTPYDLRWIATYNFTSTMNQQQLEKIDFDYKYIFSAVRQINPSFYDVKNAVRDRGIDKTYEPYIVINFTEKFFDDVIANSIPISNYKYLIVENTGNIIYDSDRSTTAQKYDYKWLSKLISEKSGITTIYKNGEKRLLFYDTIKTTQWISIVEIPYQEFFAMELSPTVGVFILGLALVLSSIYILGRISATIIRPLTDMVISFEHIGKGEFLSMKPIAGKDEIGYLVRKFNETSANIKELIKENYESKINEKEAQIMALNLQLNPHFLYNSLNAINWIAIMENQQEISEMIICLSNMLKYTVKNYGETIILKRDLEWLKNYIFLMKKRYAGVFDVQYDINPTILEYNVPRLFLQPIVENSIIHAFPNIDSGGLIKISAKECGEYLVFEVSDNGIGLDDCTIFSILNSGSTDTIGIPNVIKRIKLIYGDEYGISITSIPNVITKTKIVIGKKIPVCFGSDKTHIMG